MLVGTAACMVYEPLVGHHLPTPTPRTGDLDLVVSLPPIPFPSDEQVQDLAPAVGTLRQAVTRSDDIDDLIAAATAAIKTWPVSGGG